MSVQAGLKRFKELFPAEKIVTVEQAEGAEHLILDINNSWICKIAKVANETGLDVEAKLLQMLAGKLVTLIPVVEYYEPNFLVYRKISGVELSPELYSNLDQSQRATLAFDIAKFLHELHSALDPEIVQSELGLIATNWPWLPEELQAAAKNLNDPKLKLIFEVLINDYLHIKQAATEVCLTHNDLTIRNILVDPISGRLNGVIDFTDCALGDPCLDLRLNYLSIPELSAAIALNYIAISGMQIDLRNIYTYYLATEFSRYFQGVPAEMAKARARILALKFLIIKQLVAPTADHKVIRAMSYNIRMAPCVEDDHTENAWVYRLPKIAMILNQYSPDIIGFQEMSKSQMQQLENSRYHVTYKFIGRQPTRTPIESGLGIAYNSQKLLLVSQLQTIWLNELQDRPDAAAWDGSAYERYVIYAKFKSILTGYEFWFITTHFDHFGIIARQESAKIVMGLAGRLDAPVVITGDFNCFPQLGGLELYQLLCSHSKKIRDSEVVAGKVFGVPGSWIGWDYDPYRQREGYSKYDFIFVNEGIKVLQHGVIDDLVWDSLFQKELYPSDHRPVISDLLMELT